LPGESRGGAGGGTERGTGAGGGTERGTGAESGGGAGGGAERGTGAESGGGAGAGADCRGGAGAGAESGTGGESGTGAESESGAGGGAVLAVDVGGTHMRAAVIDASGRILDASRTSTPQDDPHPDALVDLVAKVIAGPAGQGVTRAVLGLPGQVNYSSGTLEWAPHLPVGWLAELTAAGLSGVLGLEVVLANDADMAAVGEGYFGAGQGYADVAFVTISTGVGAGVLLGRRLVHGRRSLAEIGHTVIDRCALERGRPAIMEDQASGTALARMADEAGLPGSGAEIGRLAAAGNRLAAKVWASMIEAVGIGLANLAEVFCPEVIVVGGGVGLSNGFLEPLRAQMAQRRPPQLRGTLDVVRATLGDDAGLVGAAAWHQAF
jgi:glucokinase